jgi:shikimate kinase
VKALTEIFNFPVYDLSKPEDFYYRNIKKCSGSEGFRKVETNILSQLNKNKGVVK